MSGFFLGIHAGLSAGFFLRIPQSYSPRYFFSSSSLLYASLRPI